MISAKDMPNWLVQRLPTLSAPYAEILKDRAPLSPTGGELNSYGFFSHVVCPYLEDLLAQQDHGALGELFVLLEQLDVEGDDEIRNELKVIFLEDLDDRIPVLWHHFWQALREAYGRALTWYPGESTFNAHVSRIAYERRWEAEVDALGGPPISIAREMLIRWKLTEEFRIEQRRVIEPGSAAWLDAGLPWPV